LAIIAASGERAKNEGGTFVTVYCDSAAACGRGSYGKEGERKGGRATLDGSKTSLTPAGRGGGGSEGEKEPVAVRPVSIRQGGGKKGREEGAAP